MLNVSNKLTQGALKVTSFFNSLTRFLIISYIIKRSSKLVEPAMVAKTFLIIFLATFVIFGYIWIIALLSIESLKLTLIYDLHQTIRDEEKVRRLRKHIRRCQLSTVVNKLARIQYEDETAVRPNGVIK